MHSTFSLVTPPLGESLQSGQGAIEGWANLHSWESLAVDKS